MWCWLEFNGVYTQIWSLRGDDAYAAAPCPYFHSTNWLRYSQRNQEISRMTQLREIEQLQEVLVSRTKHEASVTHVHAQKPIVYSIVLQCLLITKRSLCVGARRCGGLRDGGINDFYVPCLLNNDIDPATADFLEKERAIMMLSSKTFKLLQAA